jgi:hypothetical protein
MLPQFLDVYFSTSISSQYGTGWHLALERKESEASASLDLPIDWLRVRIVSPGVSSMARVSYLASGLKCLHQLRQVLNTLLIHRHRDSERALRAGNFQVPPNAGFVAFREGHFFLLVGLWATVDECIDSRFSTDSAVVPGPSDFGSGSPPPIAITTCSFAAPRG